MSGFLKNVAIVTTMSVMAAGLSPAHAEPISASAGSQVVFPFSMTVTDVTGPVEILFGRSFERGDTLSGRVTLEGTPTPTGNIGEYSIPDGQFAFDVPSAFALQAGNAELFKAAVFDDFTFGDQLDFFMQGCCLVPGIGFVAVEVIWFDPAGRALSSGLVPTDPRIRSRFPSSQFRMSVNSPFMWLVADSETPAPVPEPTTLLLFATGVAAIGRRVWKLR